MTVAIDAPESLAFFDGLRSWQLSMPFVETASSAWKDGWRAGDFFKPTPTDEPFLTRLSAACWRECLRSPNGDNQ